MIRKYKPEVVISMDPHCQLWSGSNYINHTRPSRSGPATLDAIAPVASMPLMYPNLAPRITCTKCGFNGLSDPTYGWTSAKPTI